MQTPSSLSIFTLTFFFVVSSANSDLIDETKFLQCLGASSLSTFPISQAIFTPSNASFSSVLQAYIKNRRFMTPGTPKPFAIVAATHQSHVQTAVICAKNHGLQVRIRSGGHDYESLSYTSNVPVVIIDMFNLRYVEVDIPSETAWVQAGATTGELYYKIAKKSKVHGFPSGLCVTLGTGGHFSGGGYGNMMRKYCLSVDNIIDAELVDVNGKILYRKSMGKDLFWAIRGGGGASFGVILSWKIKLVPVPANLTVFKVTLKQGVTDIVFQWQCVGPKLHKELFIKAMPQVVNGTSKGEKTVQITFTGHFLGRTEKLVPLLSKSFPLLGLQKNDCIEMSWVESTLFWADFPVGTPIQRLLDRPKNGQVYFKAKSDYVKEPILKAGFESIWKMMIQSERVWMQLNPYGGKMSEISETQTPLPHRKGYLFKIWYYMPWVEDGAIASNNNTNLLRRLYEGMTPYVSKLPREAFQNYRDLDIGSNPSNSTNFENAMIYGNKYFKNNFERLVDVKTNVDPSNFFKHEQSIPSRPTY